VPVVTSYIIHIGPHKTGTTYLQHAFTQLRPLLEARGIGYPDVWGNIHGHHRLTEALSRGDGAVLKPEFDRLAGAGFDTILLSSETLAYCTDAQVRLLGELLSGMTTTIVFYCRRWSELIPAHWREVVKHGSLDTLPEFVQRCLGDPMASEIVNFALVLRRYAAVFGAANLRVASYNAVVDAGADLLAHYCRSFLNWPDPPEVGLGRVNESLDMVDTEMIRALNALEWTRARDNRVGLYQRYMAAKGALPVRWIVDQSMQFTVNRVHIDDAACGLAPLHDDIAEEFRGALVPPCPGFRLFEPRAADIDYIRTDYLMQPGIMETLRDIQTKLRAADGDG
jgi:hypothetical protein